MNKTFLILGASFEMPATSVHFLESYLARVKSYATKNIADTDCVSDIEERIMEKLSQCAAKSEGITEKDVLKIVNDIGEPEDIFKDFEKKGGAPSWITHNIITEKKWSRNREEGIFLGVCAGIADNLKVSPWVVRLVFIILTPPGGFALFVYLILAVLMTTDEVPENKSKQKEDTAGSSHDYGKSVERVANDIGSLFGGVFGWFGRLIMLILWCIGIFFLASFAFGLFGGSLAFLSVGGLLLGGSTFGQIIIDNQNILQSVSSLASLSAGGFGLGLLLLASIIVLSIVRRQPVASGWFLAVFTLLGVSFFAGMASLSETISSYTTTSTATAPFVFSVPSTLTEIQIAGLDEIENNSDLHLHFNREYRYGTLPVELKKSTQTGSIRVEIVSEVWAKNSEAAESILQALSPIDVTLTGSSLVFAKKGEHSFSKVVPFANLSRKVNIFLPENMTLKRTEADRYVYHVTNSAASSRMREVGEESCFGQDLKYSSTQQAFICDNPKVINDAQKNKLDNLVRSDFRRLVKGALVASGVIIPTDSAMNSLSAGDHIRTTEWLSNDVVLVTYEDDALEFSAKLRVKKDEDGVIQATATLLDSSLKNVYPQQ